MKTESRSNGLFLAVLLVTVTVTATLLAEWPHQNTAWAWSSEAAAQSAAGEPPPKPTPIPTRQVGWFNSSAGRVPPGLVTTAQFSPTNMQECRRLFAACPGTCVSCEDLLVPMGAEVWGISPATVVVRPDSDQHPSYLHIENCATYRREQQENTSVRILLRWPDGHSEEISASTTCPSPYKFDFQDPEGQYALTIEGRTDTLSHTFQVVHDPRVVRIIDPSSGNAKDEFRSRQRIRVSYEGFGPKDRLDVGLYRVDQKPGSSWQLDLTSNLVDAWQVVVDQSGSFIEEFEAPSDTTNLPRTDKRGTTYQLAVCKAGSCGGFTWDPADLEKGPQYTSSAIWSSFMIQPSASSPTSAQVSIWVEPKGQVSFRIGDPVTICYSVSRPVYVKILACRENQSCMTVLKGQDDGTGDCLPWTVGSPAGQRTLRVEAWEDNRLIAQDEVVISVVAQ